MVAKRRVMIVDDEYLARLELKEILGRRHPDIEVVAEAASAQEAWSLITHHPELEGIFLDIHIQAESGRAGLDLAYAVNKLNVPPWIVFVTGHPQTAVEAHRLHPAHYLLKPLDDSAVDEALDWIWQKREAVSRPAVDNYPKRIAIRHRTANRFGEYEWHTEYLDPTEIVFIAKNQYANTLKVHLLQGAVLDGVNGTVKEWGGKYADLGFVQIHRSHLVNLRHVRSLRPRAGENDVYKVAFKDQACELAVGPEFLDLMREKLIGGRF